MSIVFSFQRLYWRTQRLAMPAQIQHKKDMHFMCDFKKCNRKQTWAIHLSSHHKTMMISSPSRILSGGAEQVARVSTTVWYWRTLNSPDSKLKRARARTCPCSVHRCAESLSVVVCNNVTSVLIVQSFRQSQDIFKIILSQISSRYHLRCREILNAPGISSPVLSKTTLKWITANSPTWVDSINALNVDRQIPSRAILTQDSLSQLTLGLYNTKSSR